VGVDDSGENVSTVQIDLAICGDPGGFARGQDPGNPAVVNQDPASAPNLALCHVHNGGMAQKELLFVPAKPLGRLHARRQVYRPPPGRTTPEKPQVPEQVATSHSPALRTRKGASRDG